MITLGISVTTYRSGICVLHDGTLLVRHVHDFPSLWSETKLRIILQHYREYLQRYSITAVIVKIPTDYQYTNEVKRLVRRIEALAKEYYCEFDLIKSTEIKQTLMLRSNIEMAKYAKELYPPLQSVYNKGIPTNHKYYMKMYEAIFAGHIYEKRKIAQGKGQSTLN